MSDTETAPDSTESPDPTEVGVTTLETDSDPPGGDTDADTFPREYVEKVRKESAGYRERAQTAEARATELAEQLDTRSRELFALKAACLDKLADVSDLTYDSELLDGDKLAVAVDVLLAAKPHMAKSRKPSGDIGQGSQGARSEGPRDFSQFFS